MLKLNYVISIRFLIVAKNDIAEQFRGCLHETQNEIYPRFQSKFQPTIKEILFQLLFTAGEIKCKRKMSYSEKANHFCFDEINACADVSFHIISFRIVFISYFITRN